MKKSFNSFAIVALSALMIVSCSKTLETSAPVVKDGDAQEVTVHLSVPTKTAFYDADGLQWKPGDKIYWLNTNGGGNAEYVLTAGDITDGNVASFKTTIPNLASADVTGWFKHNTHGNLGNNEVIFSDLQGKDSKYGSFVLAADITALHQESAGNANPAIIALQSSLPTPQTITAGTAEVSVEMKILGTVFRVLPYTNTYNSEQIERVEFSSSDVIAGTVEYQPSGTFRAPFWANVRKMRITLDTPMPLTGVTDKTRSNGIFFSLPQTETPLSDYKYVVYTDQADYTFSSASPLAVSNNEVKNVYLNLEKGTRLANDETIGKYWFDGNLAGGYAGNSLSYPAAETTVDDLGYWAIYTQEDIDNSVNNRNAFVYPDFIGKTVISIVDNETGVAPTWMTFGYTSASSDHLKIHLEANGGAERSATITFNYPAIAHHYSLRAGEPLKTITVTQAADAVVEPTITTTSPLSLSNGKHFDVPLTLGFDINGTPASDSDFNAYMGTSTLTVTNARVKRSGRNVTLEILPNPTASARDIVVTLDYQGSAETLTFTQAAAVAAYQPPYKYSISGWTKIQGDKSFNLAADGTGGSDWLCAFGSLQKWDGAEWVNVTDQAQVDMDVLCDQMFGTDNDSRWVNLVWNSFSAYAGECIIRTQEGHPAAANTGAARSFSGQVMEYDHSAHIYNITINQAEAPVVVTPTLTKVYLTDISEDGETITAAATLELDINGTPSADVQADAATYGVTLSCPGATATITNAAGNVQIVFPANATASTKDYTLTANGTTSDSITFTQAAGSGGGAALTYIFTTLNYGPASGNAWGIGYNQPVTGRYIDIKNISRVDGQAIDFASERDAIIAEAISITTAGGDPLDPSILAFPYNFMDGSIIVCGFATGDTPVSGAVVTWYSSDGSTKTEVGHWTINIPS